MELFMGVMSGAVGGAVFIMVICNGVIKENAVLKSHLKAESNIFVRLIKHIAVSESLIIHYSMREGRIVGLETFKATSQRDPKTGKFLKKVGTAIEIVGGPF